MTTGRTVLDHRGRATTLCDENALPEGTARAVRTSVWMAARSRPARLALRIAVLALVMVGVRLGFQLVRGGVNSVELFGSGLTVAIVAGLLIGYARVAGRRNDGRAAAACLGAGLCPGCGYCLEGIEVAGDGCRVCPECGAAWRSGNRGAPPTNKPISSSPLE